MARKRKMTVESQSEPRFGRGGRRAGAGRKPLFDKPMTPNEMVRRSRALAKQRKAQPPPPTTSEILGPQLAVIAAQLTELARQAEGERQRRRDEKEAFQPILRRLLAIEQALKLAEVPHVPKVSRRHPTGL